MHKQDRCNDHRLCGERRLAGYARLATLFKLMKESTLAADATTCCLQRGTATARVCLIAVPVKGLLVADRPDNNDEDDAMITVCAAMFER